MKAITTHKQRIFGLDVVRATAILCVLCSHSTILLFQESKSLVITIIQFFGTIGVDVFFILSGFLIGTILIKHIEKGETRIKDFGYFWSRRWFRTLPNYFLILIINIILYYLFNSELPDRVSSYFFFLHNFNQVQPDFFTEAWTISIEEFAYLLGPILLLIFGLIFKKINKTAFLLVALLIIIVFNIHRFAFHFSNPSEALSWSKAFRKIVIYRLDSIYYGFIAGYFAYYYTAIWKKYKKVSFVLGIIIFLSIHVYIFMHNLEPSVTSLFFNGFYLTIVPISILLLFPVFSTWKKGRLLSKIITKISIWSYAIYLTNYSIVLLSLKEFVNVSKLNSFEKGLLLLVFWGVTFILSILLYNLFEKPMMQLRDSKRVKQFFASK